MLCQFLKYNHYNPGQNILELYYVAVQVWFCANQIVFYIYYKRLCIRAASWVVEQLKTEDLAKLENIRKVWKLDSCTTLYPLSISKGYNRSQKVRLNVQGSKDFDQKKIIQS